LQSLNLTNNRIGNLPAQIGELKKLQSLYLSDNQLQSLPAQIGDLKNLQSLELTGNQLQTLPIESLGKMTNLKKIVLANESSTNPLPTITVTNLRSVMPWCEIEFN
jgi:Leucine-rich repeat (LRR) protein